MHKYSTSECPRTGDSLFMSLSPVETAVRGRGWCGSAAGVLAGGSGVAGGRAGSSAAPTYPPLRSFPSATPPRPPLRSFFSYSGGSRGVADGKRRSGRGRERARRYRCERSRHPTCLFCPISSARLTADADGPVGGWFGDSKRWPARIFHPRTRTPLVSEGRDDAISRARGVVVHA